MADETTEQSPAPTSEEQAPKRPRTPKGESAGTARPQPSVGRTVHYQEGENPPLAAIITAVSEEDGVSLVVFRPHLQMFRQSVPFAEKPKNGHWNWPERV